MRNGNVKSFMKNRGSLYEKRKTTSRTGVSPVRTFMEAASSELLEKVNYIANNPIKANLAEEYEDCKWLYIKGWINDYS